MSDVLSIKSDHGPCLHPSRRVEACYPPREPVADGLQCRIWLNEARREIDRLRRGMATPPSPKCDRIEIGPAWPDECPGDKPASAETSRRIYAPPPLGDVSTIKPRQVPPPPQVPAVANYFHVTNLGSLLDVLA